MDRKLMNTKPAIDRSYNKITTRQTNPSTLEVEPESANSVARRIVRAELSLKIGDAKSCASEARQILAADPTHVGAMELLAKALWQSCDFTELLPVIDRLVVLNPYEPGYHTLRGNVYQALGRYGDAVRSMERGTKSGDNSAMREIQEWQADLIAVLLHEDEVFKMHYAQDPERACLDRGFAFESTPSSERWLSEKQMAVPLYARPS